MNSTIKTLLLVTSLTTSIASAAVTSIAVDNFETPSFNEILLSNNTPLLTSSSAFFLGTFNEATIATADTIQELYNGFTLFGEITTPENTNPVISPGYFAGRAVGEVSEFNGDAVYIFIIDSASIESATQALIWKLDGQTFSTGLDPISTFDDSPQIINMLSGNGTAVFGVDAENDQDPYQLLPIPEPSGLALLGLGAVATLLRRRR